MRERVISRAQLRAIATQPWVWVVGLTVVGFLLRRIHLGAELLWFDEADIVAQARQPLDVVIGAFARAGRTAPCTRSCSISGWGCTTTCRAWPA